MSKPVSCTVVNHKETIEKCHKAHHFGIEKTLFLVRKKFPGITKEEVRQAIANCFECRSIDPAPTVWEKGELGTEANWTRLSIDVTHAGAKSYLTCVDCGPSRFAIWREIRNEDAPTIAYECESIFRERGPPAELLMALRSSLDS